MAPTKAVDEGALVDIGDARVGAVLRQAGLTFRERFVLGAYMHFEPTQGRLCGMPGVCWPTDTEVAEYLRSSVITIRRGRRSLAEPRKTGGGGPLIHVRYVPPFGALPDGTTTMHGTNVVTFALLGGAAHSAPVAKELSEAQREAAELERKLAALKGRIATLAGALGGRAAANDPAPTHGTRGKTRRRPSTHNAPSVTTPEWSLWRPGPALENEGRGDLRAAA